MPAIILGGAALGAGGNLLGGIFQSNAATNAANTILEGEQQGISAEQGFIGRGLGAISGYTGQGVSNIMSLLAPYLGIPTAGGGGGVLKTLAGLLTGGPGGANASKILSNVPGLSWLQGQGQLGVSAQAGQRGLGGNALQGGAQVANQIGLASGFQPVVSALQSLLNTGAGAAISGASSIGSLLGSAASGAGSLLGGAGNTISNLISGASSNIAQTQIGKGNAIAGATTGATNAFGGGLTTAGILSALTGGSAGGLFSGGGGGTIGDRVSDYVQDFND